MRVRILATASKCDDLRSLMFVHRMQKNCPCLREYTRRPPCASSLDHTENRLSLQRHCDSNQHWGSVGEEVRWKQIQALHSATPERKVHNKTRALLTEPISSTITSPRVAELLCRPNQNNGNMCRCHCVVHLAWWEASTCGHRRSVCLCGHEG